jgi:Lrp/AsnC family transcriptional regulator, leucine-responsive regulatory protein
MHSFDDTDRKILSLLQDNAKRTYADMSERVSLSIASVKRRVDRLEREGVIRGYAALVDTAKLGGGIEAIIEIYCADRTGPSDVRKSVEKMAEVVTAFTVSGEPDAIARVRVTGIPHLESVVEKLRRDPNVVRTRTMIVLSTIMDRSTAMPV